MLTAECYKQRMERGLTFFEFNYMLMQGYDFLELNRRYGCKLEMGGNDQWSNILAGADLIRRKEKKDAYGLTSVSYTHLITATGRISSTEPNLQNIPIRMELGRAIRKVFLPEEGYIFLDADYSQIELRVLAHLSQDEKLIHAYEENQDIHARTASEVFGIPMDEVTSTQRRDAKAVNFGIIYGLSAFGLSQDLKISRKQAQEYICLLYTSDSPGSINPAGNSYI